MRDYLEILTHLKNKDREYSPQELLEAFIEDQQDNLQ